MAGPIDYLQAARDRRAVEAYPRALPPSAEERYRMGIAKQCAEALALARECGVPVPRPPLRRIGYDDPHLDD